MRQLNSMPFEQFKIPIGTGKYFTEFQYNSLNTFPIEKEIYKNFPLKCNKNKDCFINLKLSFAINQTIDTIISISRS